MRKIWLEISEPFLHLFFPVISECLNMVRMSDKRSLRFDWKYQNGLCERVLLASFDCPCPTLSSVYNAPCLTSLLRLRNMNCSGKSSVQGESFSENSIQISYFSFLSALSTSGHLIKELSQEQSKKSTFTFRLPLKLVHFFNNSSLTSAWPITCTSLVHNCLG